MFCRSTHVCEADSDFWSPSAVACTWAAYCKFQRTSSMDGRADGSDDIHLLVREITIDKESWAQVVSTIGSTMRVRPSWLLNDEACEKEAEEAAAAAQNSKLKILLSDNWNGKISVSLVHNIFAVTTHHHYTKTTPIKVIKEKKCEKESPKNFF